MHLFLKNTIPTLIKLWMEKYKGLDGGMGNYHISKEVWNKIGLETTAAVKDIPAAFVWWLPNIVTEQKYFTAEAWGF